MTWAQYVAARQLLAEERMGARVRDAQRAEQAQVDETKAAIRRHEGAA